MNQAVADPSTVRLAKSVSASEEAGSPDSVFAIVSTIHFLLLVDLTTRSVVPIESHRPGYYGISWHAQGEDLVLSHDRAGHITFADLASYAVSEVGTVSCGQ